MHILYITQHFPPETGAAQGRAYEMAKNLVKLGNEVTVITGMPNYPEGKIYKEYKGKLYSKEEIEDVKVIRTFLVPDNKKNSLVRILNYFSFLISSIIGGLFITDVDVVYATSPQLFVGLSGYIISLIKRAEFVLEIRDLWVDFAIHLDQLKNKFLINFSRKMENFLYEKADKIIVVTEGFKDKIIEDGINQSKIEVVTNGIDIEHFTPIKKDKSILNIENIKNKFVVMYAGNIGTAQGLKVMLESAKKTKEVKDIQYVIIGTGVETDKLKKYKKENNLTNVSFLGLKPKSEIANYLCSADLLLITLKDLPFFDITIPSKVFDYMATGQPIVIGVKGEARKIVEKAGAGKYFEPENSSELATQILNFYNGEYNINKMKINARKYAVNNFSRYKLAQKLDNVLEKIYRE
ncbi:MAG: glycosyltransferase family 4 protein [Bacillota bacterium]